MNHSTLLMSAGLCLFSLACGSADPVDSEADAIESSNGVFAIAKIWELQLPTGSGTSPTTVSPSSLASFSDAFYFKASDGGQVFVDPAHGITTSGSKHPRAEMRESTSSGAEAAWSAAGTNTMTVTGKVLRVGGGSSGAVTVGQVFNGTDSITLCELQYSNAAKGFKLFYEEAKGEGGSPIDLKTPVALDSKYTFTLALTKDELTVTINGKQVYSHTPSANILKKKFYFKFGAYDQTATAGTVSTTPYTEVESYSASVVHK
jgi:hypothetical protein